MNGLALCAGVGGLELGLGLALQDYRTVCYVEREAYAAAVLATRMEEGWLDKAPIWDDLTTFDGGRWRGKVDIVSAGYPCQPFSVAGKRQGSNDPRHLWPHVARTIQECEPLLVFLENVGGHLRLGGQRVLEELRGMGYQVAAGLFTAEEVGAPHKRMRLYILAYSRRQLRDRFCFCGNGSSHGKEQANDWEKEIREQNRKLATLAPFNRLCGYWPSESNLDRVAPNGLAERLDRIRTIGNGVVPIVAAYAFRTLAEALCEK